jgi:hypothetical protein
VREEGAGTAAELAQVGQRQAVGSRRLPEAIGDPVDAPRAELGLDVLTPVKTLRRDRRVELERSEAPVQLLRLVSEQVECGEPARRADVTPRSDDVGPNDDVDHAVPPRGWTFRRVLPQDEAE